jgi:PTS system nitrogen regulatory IIA component
MQLTVRDVSRFLDVPEATVTRWIKQGGLPTQRVGGQYRFNRSEVMEWATANEIKVSRALFDQPETDDGQVSLVDGLESGGIFHHLQASRKDEALSAMVKVLRLPEDVDREWLVQLLLAREALTTTAIGNGIALPHVRNPLVLHVERPMVTLCFLETPVDLGAMDGKPVGVLFSLICPTIRGHLQMLSRLSFALRDDRFRNVVMSQGRPEEILGEARRVEAALSAPAVETRKSSD